MLSPQNIGQWGRSIVTILQQTGGADGYGEPTSTFSNFAANVRCSILPLSGREQYNAQQINALVNYKITVRYGVVKVPYESDTIATLWAEDDFGRFYDIQAAITPDQRKQWIDLLCVVRSGRGPNGLNIGGVGDVWTPYDMSSQVDGAKTVFTLPIALPTTSFQIAADGIVLRSTADFTVNGTQLTLVTAPQTALVLFA